MFNNNSINCNYNLIFTKFNEIIDYKPNIYTNVQYPTFHNLKNCNSNVQTQVLNSLNEKIKTEINAFLSDIKTQEKETNKTDEINNKYKIFSDFSVSFNKSNILSTTINLMTITNNENLDYNELYNYNVDLKTGNILSLSDVFVESIDFKTVVSNYVKYKISQNKNMFFENVFVEIVSDQAFYLTYDSVVVYFEAGTLAPKQEGTIKFKMEYRKFLPYIKPKFYCTPENLIL